MDDLNETTSTETSSASGTISEAASRFASMLDLSNGETAESTVDTEDNSAPSEVAEHDAEADTPQEHPEAEGEVADDAGSEADDQPEAEPVDVRAIKDDETVIYKGKEIKVSEIPGYMKHEDYKQGTRENAETKRQLAENANTARGQVIEYMDRTRAEFMAALPAMPDLGKLVEEDPDEYIRQKHIWDQRAVAAQKFEREYQAIVQEKQQAEKQQFEAAQHECHKTLREWHPEFNDEATGNLVTQNFGKWLAKEGFPAEAVMGETNPKVLSMAYRLYKTEQASSNATKAVARVDAKPALTKPGSTTAKPAQTATDKLDAMGKRTGDISINAKRWASRL